MGHIPVRAVEGINLSIRGDSCDVRVCTCDEAGQSRRGGHESGELLESISENRHVKIVIEEFCDFDGEQSVDYDRVKESLRASILGICHGEVEFIETVPPEERKL